MDKESLLKNIINNRSVWIILAGFLILISFGFVFYKYKSALWELEKVKALAGKAVPNENEELIKKVGKLIELPSGTPVIATVSNLDQLKDQPFFSKAKIGDKVLVFMEEKKAILYDPKSNKIIDVAPVSVPTLEATGSAKIEEKLTPTVKAEVLSQKYKIALYNGTSVVGLTKKYEEEVVKILPKVEIVKKADAKENYEESILINYSDLKEEEIGEVSKTLGIKVGKLPEGEKELEGVDFLIILGEDKDDKGV